MKKKLSTYKKKKKPEKQIFAPWCLLRNEQGYNILNH